jgi:hypothetical protein
VLKQFAAFSSSLVVSGALGATLLAAPAFAQSKDNSAVQGCDPGFVQRVYPHGSELNFRCRTRVIDCPERPGHHVAVIPEPSFETAQGVQFGYRCEYMSRER